ncbi:MAG TPA: stage II sporulation protein D [Symbiobacteriaceae bacterium]
MRRFGLVALVYLVMALVGVPILLTRLAAAPPPAESVDGTDLLPIQVYFPDTQEIRSLPLGEYLKGVVAAEMPPEFETEALKAQFIVARTYAVRRMQQFNGPGRGGCPLNPAADVCADPATGQAYMSLEELSAKIGERKAWAYWRRLSRVQAETEGLVIRYQGELIDPLYHAVSGTKTAAADEYYTQSLPYLQSVDDHWGADAPSLVVMESFTPEELAERLSVEGTTIPAAVVTAAAEAGKVPVEILERTPSQRVRRVKVGDVVLSGREFRERLNLRSTNFNVSLQDGKIVIETTGYGHGVGMSQYGANGMAKAGKGYQEILNHYYQGITLDRLFAG